MFKIGDLVEADRKKFTNDEMDFYVDLYEGYWQGLIGIIIETTRKQVKGEVV